MSKENTARVLTSFTRKIKNMGRLKLSPGRSRITTDFTGHILARHWSTKQQIIKPRISSTNFLLGHRIICKTSTTEASFPTGMDPKGVIKNNINIVKKTDITTNKTHMEN
jgi:hypothetical protein